MLFGEIRSLLRQNFPTQAELLETLVKDVEALYRGEWPSWQACQVPYHTIDHVYGVLLVALQIFVGDCQRRQLQCMNMETSRIKVLTAAALFHDSGYLKSCDDLHQGLGGQYTFEHVERSQRLAQRYLVDRPGWAVDQCQAVQALIGATKIVDGNDELIIPAARFEGLCDMLASADLLAQVADDHYLEKLPSLYVEFEEAYDWKGREQLRQRGFVVFDSYEKLLAGSGCFIRGQVLPRLKAMGDQEQVLQVYFGQNPSPYMRQLRLNMQCIDALDVAIFA